MSPADDPPPAAVPEPPATPDPASTATAEVTVLGEGVLGWPNMERVSDRYGVVDLMHEPDGDTCVVFDEITAQTRGTLVAVVLEVLDDWAFRDHYGTGALYLRPAVNEAVTLGTGTLFTENFASMHGDRPGRILAGVRPDDGRDERWLDSAALSRVHHQRVRLEFHPDPPLQPTPLT